MNYVVGTEIFTNKYLAFANSKKTGNPIRFALYEEAFDKASWDIEPNMSWDSMLDIRARQLADKKKPIVLGFSGGTDSYTVYEVFKRNNIPIAAAHIRIKSNEGLEDLMYVEALDFIYKEAAQRNFKVFKTVGTKNQYNAIYDTPDWVWKTNQRLQFGVGLPEELSIEKNESYDWGLDQDYIYVTGHDKPRLIIQNDSFYSFQDDQTWHNLSDTRVHPFFINSEFPELHIKQSYMLAKYIKGLSIEQNKPLESYQEIWNANKFDSLAYSMLGCGRDGDLAKSEIQKKLNRNSKLIIPSILASKIEYSGRDCNLFYESVRNKEKFIMNYFKGLVLLKNDSLTKDIFCSEDNFYSVKSISTKLYKLGQTI
jgi:hypothetical protein